MNKNDKSILEKIQPTFRHIGYIVKDIRTAAEQLTKTFPMMEPWRFCTTYMSKKEVVDGRDCKLIIGLSRVNDFTIELVEAMQETPNCYHAQQADWSVHTSFVYEKQEDYEAVYEYMLTAGHKIVFGANQKKTGEKCFYLQHKNGGPVIEINNLFPQDPEFLSLDLALDAAQSEE